MRYMTAIKNIMPIIPVTNRQQAAKANALDKNAEIKKETANINKQSWLQHSYTREHIKEMELRRVDFLEKAENLSISTPRDIDKIINYLVRSKQIKEEIEYAIKMCQ